MKKFTPRKLKKKKIKLKSSKQAEKLLEAFIFRNIHKKYSNLLYR